jgi:hypothetical protein
MELGLEKKIYKLLCIEEFKHEISVLGDAGYRSRYLSHAKRALFHLSYTPVTPIVVVDNLVQHFHHLGLPGVYYLHLDDILNNHLSKSIFSTLLAVLRL